MHLPGLPDISREDADTNPTQMLTAYEQCVDEHGQSMQHFIDGMDYG